MAFNLGAKLRGFKDFLGAVEAKDWAKASAAMLDSTWAKQTKTRADRLAKMMLTGNDYK
jgi:lysozyme